MSTACLQACAAAATPKLCVLCERLALHLQERNRRALELLLQKDVTLRSLQQQLAAAQGQAAGQQAATAACRSRAEAAEAAALQQQQQHLEELVRPAHSICAPNSVHGAQRLPSAHLAHKASGVVSAVACSTVKCKEEDLASTHLLIWCSCQRMLAAKTAWRPVAAPLVSGLVAGGDGQRQSLSV